MFQTAGSMQQAQIALCMILLQDDILDMICVGLSPFLNSLYHPAATHLHLASSNKPASAAAAAAATCVSPAMIVPTCIAAWPSRPGQGRRWWRWVTACSCLADR
jgi:hypothetical protein